MIRFWPDCRDSSTLLDRRHIIRNFDKTASSYHHAAVCQREIADRLLDRLEFVKIAPKVIVEVGARTGYITENLGRCYPDAQLIATDWSINSLQKLTANPNLLRITADPDHIPLASSSADLLIANLVWTWSNNGQDCLREWRRLLKPGGLLLFTAFGPDTLCELRASFAAVDESAHVHLFLDMHDIGDLVLSAQFSDTVMQAERITFNYARLAGLWHDLRGTGFTNVLTSRRRGLTGKNLWRNMELAYHQWVSSEGDWPVSVEVVYGVGWAQEPSSKQTNDQGEVSIPVSDIKIHGGRYGS
ncbi:MAG: methyltransferase domain-containing protein [Proteobacteria bacterium]|nr:methyltransferase domain-containing protein [Pseudomonadota bacterium]